MDHFKNKRIAFLFPGQGAQTVGMGKDFFDNFAVARATFEEADDLLRRPLSRIIFEGPSQLLTETKNSQVGIYTVSVAILRVVEELHGIRPYICSGLSLGEYTALTAGGWLKFSDGLPLVEKRGAFMDAACEQQSGKMAVILGLATAVVEKTVQEIGLQESALKDELWIANYNCPGQVVLSGTARAIEVAIAAAKAAGAKRALLLDVHGAFHSGLMAPARERLAPFLEEAPLMQGEAHLVMNVSGKLVPKLGDMRQNLIYQITRSVLWEQGISEIEKEGVGLYIGFGPGKTLAGLNKQIGVKAPTLTIDKVEDLHLLSERNA